MRPPRAGGLARDLSTWLDILRCAAAFVVLLWHAGLQRNAAPLVGRDALIVIFIVSGYVIARVARDGEPTLRGFLASRMARVYSVVLPALAITAALDLTVLAQDHETYAWAHQYREPWLYGPMILAFAYEWWFLGEQALTNIPFWTMGYEVWYYVLYALFSYHAGARRWLLAGAVALLVGPRILADMPVWLVGVGVARLHGRMRLGRTPARCVFWASLVLGLALPLSGLDNRLYVASDALTGGWLDRNMGYSRFVASDMLNALVWGANVLALPFAGFRLLDGARLRRALTWLAGLTATLYLAHYPLLRLSWYTIAFENPLLTMAAQVAFVLAVVACVAHRFERWKFPLRRALRAAFGVAHTGRGVSAPLPPSWPGSTRPPTFWLRRRKQHVGSRGKPGHDGQ